MSESEKVYNYGFNNQGSGGGSNYNNSYEEPPKKQGKAGYNFLRSNKKFDKYNSPNTKKFEPKGFNPNS